jgi:hypothetical protein
VSLRACELTRAGQPVQLGRCRVSRAIPAAAATALTTRSAIGLRQVILGEEASGADVASSIIHALTRRRHVLTGRDQGQGGKRFDQPLAVRGVTAAEGESEPGHGFSVAPRTARGRSPASAPGRERPGRTRLARVALGPGTEHVGLLDGWHAGQLVTEAPEDTNGLREFCG